MIDGNLWTEEGKYSSNAKKFTNIHDRKKDENYHNHNINQENHNINRKNKHKS